MTALNPAVVRWFEGRGISAETVIHTGISSGRRVTNGDEAVVEPDAAGNIIVFPFVDGGNVVNEKYRMAGKRFAQKPNSRKTFFNADVIDDPMLIDGRAALVITEGEMDCLSAMEAGYPFAVSVPDGAPPARDKDGNLIVVPDGTSDLDPATDEKYRYITNNLERLGRVKRIVIATDGDEPGQRLAAELVRRLGRVRCLFVNYPEGCKDLNDVLLKHGQADVIRVISAAKPYPVSGVYKLSDFPEEGELTTFSTGWGRLDPHLRLYYPAFMVVTGKAGGGKSTWTNQLASHMAKNYGWTVGIASFEMRVRPFVTGTLAAAMLGKPRHTWTQQDREQSNAWIEDHFVFIAPDPEDEAVHDMAWLLERAEIAVIRHGMRMLVVDPWNEIEHEKRRDETSTEYTGRAIKMLKRFGRQFDCLVVLVAHPSKSGAEKDPDRLSLYDISDSSHFANKADLGVVIARAGDPRFDTTTAVMVKKIRYQPEAGRLGDVTVTFDKANGIFSQ